MSDASLSRQTIVHAATRLLERDGLDGLSLRRLAAELGVTAPALYAHVDGKADLLATLAESGFDQLVRRYDEIETASTDGPADDPSASLGRLRRLANAYVDQALAEPELFRLMFRFRPQPFASTAPTDELPAATRAFNHPYQAVVAAIEAGDLAADADPMLVAMTLWTVAHGTAEVLLLGLELTDGQQRDLRESVLGATLAGLRPA